MSDERQDLQDFGWAILELMGHRRLAGRVTEAMVADVKMVRIDVPTADGLGLVTQFYGGGAVYALTPTSEEAARAVAAAGARPEPVHRWELPAAAGAGSVDEDDIDFDAIVEP